MKDSNGFLLSVGDHIAWSNRYSIYTGVIKSFSSKGLPMVLHTSQSMEDPEKNQGWKYTGKIFEHHTNYGTGTEGRLAPVRSNNIINITAYVKGLNNTIK